MTGSSAPGESVTGSGPGSVVNPGPGDPDAVAERNSGQSHGQSHGPNNGPYDGVDHGADHGAGRGGGSGAASPDGPALFAVVIPASNEEGYIGACLDALLASDAAAGPVGIVVAANGCRDGTVAVARARIPAAEARGWPLVVLDIPEGHKTGAINRADAAIAAGALGPAPAFLAYLDADILLDPALLGQLRATLDRPAPAYASGQLQVSPARSRVTRAYARTWSRLPFMTHGVTGAGFYAVNAAGRRRWDLYPDLIADDIYVRLMFAPAERLGVPAPYSWPMAEGFSRLVRVRRRQNAGVDDFARRWPELLANEDKPRLGLGGLLALALRRPTDLAVYAAVAAAVRLTRRERQDWSRGR